MHDAVVAMLTCPHGEDRLTLEDRTLVCPAGHRFDLARQGYANLLTSPAPAAADSAQMVAARVAFQQAGHHSAINRAIIEAAAAEAPGDGRRVVDVGAGTGGHLGEVVSHVGAPAGLAIDVSKRAAQRAARVHERVGAIVADVWHPLPVRDGAADIVLNVFAPRVPVEFARILAPGGAVIVVTAAPQHHRSLIDQLGLLQVGADKTGRLDAAMAEVGTLTGRTIVEDVAYLNHDDIMNAVLMGPNAHHVDEAHLQGKVRALAPTTEVEVAATVSTYRR